MRTLYEGFLFKYLNDSGEVKKDLKIDYEAIEEYVDRLTETIYKSRIEREQTISWELFYDELFIECRKNDIYYPGAIALAISTLCNRSNKNAKYKRLFPNKCG